MQILSNLDTFRVTKLGDEFTQRSASGGALTVLAYLLGLALFMQELRLYRSVERVTDLFVDTDDAQLMPIHLDVTFHRLPCGVTGLDVDNLIGESEENVAAVTKTRLDADGNEIGAEDQFTTEMPSTEVPMWEKQRMAQQAEFERELMRQAEAQELQSQRQKQRQQQQEQQRERLQMIKQERVASREGVRRQLLPSARRALAASEPLLPAATGEASAAVVATDNVSPPALPPPPTRTAAVLQEEMKKKLDDVVAGLQQSSHDTGDGAAVAADDASTAADVGATAAELQDATDLTAATASREIQTADAVNDTAGGENSHNPIASNVERTAAGSVDKQLKPSPKQLTADEELKQLTDYYHISPPPPTQKPQPSSPSAPASAAPSESSSSPSPVPKAWTPVSGKAQLVRPANHNHPPAPAGAPVLLLNGVPFGGESVTGADRGYDRGTAEARVHEGCRVTGTFSVQRVPGNFHFSSHAYAGKFMRTATMRQFFPPGLFLGVS